MPGNSVFSVDNKRVGMGQCPARWNAVHGTQDASDPWFGLIAT